MNGRINAFISAMQRRVVGRSALVIAGNMTRALAGFLTGLCVARILGPQEFGTFSLFIVVTMFVHALMGEGFDSGVVRYYAHCSKHVPGSTGSVLGMALTLRIVVGVPALAFGLLSSESLAAEWFDDALASEAIRYGVVTGFAASFCTFTISVFQARQTFVAYSLLSPLVNVLRLAAVPLMIAAAHFTLYWVMGLHAALFAMCAGLGIWLLRDEFRHVELKARMSMDIVNFSKWTALANLAFIVPIHIAVPMLSHYRGAGEAGLYMAGMTLLLVIDQITFGILTTQLPALSRADSTTELRRYVRTGLPIFAGMAACLALLGFVAEPLIVAVYGEAYIPSIAVFRILLAGFLATLITHPIYLVLYAIGRPAPYAIASVAALLLWVVAAIALVPAYGANGAAAAALAARLTQGALIAWAVVRVLRGPEISLAHLEPSETR